MSASGSKSNERVAHFMIDIHNVAYFFKSFLFTIYLESKIADGKN